MKRSGSLKNLVLFFALNIAFVSGYSQSLLDRNIRLNVVRQPLSDVLEILSNEGNFFFSYNSSIINRDTLVTITESGKTLRQLLGLIFTSGFEFRESGNYIIIRRAPIRITLVTNQAKTEDNFYTVTGYVLDNQSGLKIPYASVYERQRLNVSMTDEQGYFKLRLKSKYKTAAISVSKQYYEDTTVVIEPRYNQQVTITIIPLEIQEQNVVIGPKNYVAPDSIMIAVQQNDSVKWLYTYRKTDSVKVENSRFANFLISSKQKLQSLNLSKFFTVRPVQASLVPGLSTNGKLNSQVVNNFSFNLVGGYSGGVNGMEIGGLFNINKKDVQYLQIGGLLNVVGRSMTGVQIGGVNNTVLGDLSGIQVAGINNYAGISSRGIQLAGIYNHTGNTIKGIQLAGIANFANKKTTGLQIAGISNISSSEVKGLQISGIFNYTRRLRGVQIGLINISERSDGYSIGLINIVTRGYHKVAVWTNETMNLNAAFKTGNKRLYSILLAGMNYGTEEKIWSYGYGLGTEIPFSKTFGINPEITSQYLHLGSWDHLNLLNKFNLNFHINLFRGVQLFGGPSFNAYYSNQTAKVDGYKFDIPYTSQNRFKLLDKTTGWIGWNAGIAFF